MQKKLDEYIKRFPSISSITVDRSRRQGKRFRATMVINGKYVTKHFGDPEATTFFDVPDDLKRKSYRARASAIVDKHGNLTYNKPGSANSLAYWLLW
jgi:hypothetical protein